MRTFLSTSLVISVLGISFALGGCGGESSSASGGAASSSSSSSSGEGGSGGAAGAGGMGGMGQGGAAGAGGMGQGGMGTGGQGGAGGGAAVCDAPMNNPCFECLHKDCTMAYCDCAAEPACTKMLPCMQQCPQGDQGCQQNCQQVNSLGLAEFLVMAECAGTTCLSSCQGAEPVGACQLCLAQQCEQELESCYGNPECTAFVACAQACPQGNMNCINLCMTDHAGGVNQATQLRDCSVSGCPMVCN